MALNEGLKVVEKCKQFHELKCGQLFAFATKPKEIYVRTEANYAVSLLSGSYYPYVMDAEVVLPTSVKIEL